MLINKYGKKKNIKRVLYLGTEIVVAKGRRL
jgi:hypothetical protein